MTTEASQERFRWPHVAICGLLWGLVVTMAVTLSQPVGDLPLNDLIRWTAALAFQFGVAGLVWASGCKLAEDLRRPLALFMATLVGACLVVTLLALSPLGAGDAAPGNFGRLSEKLPLFDLAAYTLWVNLFYGGLYAVGYRATRNALRLRRRLVTLRFARSEAEAQFREARLQAVRGQLQPAMLLEALDSLRRTYNNNPAASGRLFDLLILFLRAAMPGLRSGTSSLLEELSLVTRYAALRDALETGPPLWRLSLHDPPADLAFPPLRLLPALDRLSRAAPPDATVEVTAAEAGDLFVVQIGVPAPRALPSTLLQRLRSVMQRDLGPGATTLAEHAGAMVGELRVRLPKPTTSFSTSLEGNRP